MTSWLSLGLCEYPSPRPGTRSTCCGRITRCTSAGRGPSATGPATSRCRTPTSFSSRLPPQRAPDRLRVRRVRPRRLPHRRRHRRGRARQAHDLPGPRGPRRRRLVRAHARELAAASRCRRPIRVAGMVFGARDAYPVVLPEYRRRTNRSTRTSSSMSCRTSSRRTTSSCWPTEPPASWPSRRSAVKRGQRVIVNSGTAGMGYDLPAAIGAAFALVAQPAVGRAGA